MNKGTLAAYLLTAAAIGYAAGLRNWFRVRSFRFYWQQRGKK